jgi:hypothetical protein
MRCMPCLVFAMNSCSNNNNKNNKNNNDDKKNTYTHKSGIQCETIHYNIIYWIDIAWDQSLLVIINILVYCELWICRKKI